MLIQVQKRIRVVDNSNLFAELWRLRGARHSLVFWGHKCNT